MNTGFSSEALTFSLEWDEEHEPDWAKFDLLFKAIWNIAVECDSRCTVELMAAMGIAGTAIRANADQAAVESYLHHVGHLAESLRNAGYTGNPKLDQDLEKIRDIAFSRT